MLFVPSVAILPTYFSSKIGLAIGLAASGSSMGGTKKIHPQWRCDLLIFAQASSTQSSSTASSPAWVSAGPSASWASWPSPPCSSPSR